MWYRGKVPIIECLCLKNRGVKDVLIICSDRLTGIKEAIVVAYPKYFAAEKREEKARNQMISILSYIWSPYRSHLNVPINRID